MRVLSETTADLVLHMRSNIRSKQVRQSLGNQGNDSFFFSGWTQRSASLGIHSNPILTTCGRTQHRRSASTDVGHHTRITERLRQLRNLVVECLPGHRSAQPVLAPEDQRLALIAPAQQVFRVVEPRLRKPAGARHTISVDQRGLPRPQGSACDIGAFELELLVPLAALVADVEIDLEPSAETSAGSRRDLRSRRSLPAESVPDSQ